MPAVARIIASSASIIPLGNSPQITSYSASDAERD